MGGFINMINPGSDQEKEYLKYLLKKYGATKEHQGMILTKINVKQNLHD